MFQVDIIESCKQRHETTSVLPLFPYYYENRILNVMFGIFVVSEN